MNNNQESDKNKVCLIILNKSQDNSKPSLRSKQHESYTFVSAGLKRPWKRDKMHPCGFCETEFEGKHDVLVHVSSKHYQEAIDACESEVRDKFKAKLDELKAYYNRTVECDYCGQPKSRKSIKRHMKENCKDRPNK